MITASAAALALAVLALVLLPLRAQGDDTQSAPATLAPATMEAIERTLELWYCPHCGEKLARPNQRPCPHCGGPEEGPGQ
ncbi:MAG: zinc-ribbon domain-containing protein [Firmicutes bacterium]|nr:zinc-ribbon domain-containing protein [Bacillota bacterium]